MSSWINTQKDLVTTYAISIPVDEADKINKLNENQRKAFELIINHSQSSNACQLLVLIVGKAGSGKSFLIDRLRFALQDTCIISALFWDCCIQCQW